MDILPTLSNAVMRYLDFYQRWLAEKWDHMTPMQYGTLLIFIGFIGWLWMRSGPK